MRCYYHTSFQDPKLNGVGGILTSQDVFCHTVITDSKKLKVYNNGKAFNDTISIQSFMKMGQSNNTLGPKQYTNKSHLPENN